MNQVNINRDIKFYEDRNEYTGVKKIAEKVKNDMNLVFKGLPEEWNETDQVDQVIIYGTLGKSKLLEQIEMKGKINFDLLREKWEVFSMTLVEQPLEGIERAIVIAGSDKRGTIYGLFHLSEWIGVSPLVNWNHVWPTHKEQVTFTQSDNMISKVPSVKYRGFFINDEWPAFGTWAKEHFGGMNAECYDRVFELLLRLKGNYLWPAMWNSNFNLDGPDLRSAELADEYGVVMSTSHHEPCMRSGQEYGKVRGNDSQYGDAWNFKTNQQGITNFWRDGLIRNKSFDNVYTLGMRGENDTAIMQNATLHDNIQLLRDVLKTQNKLLREIVNEDLSKIPRQIVLFTEVEEFFYGNEETKGLINDPELEGVTLILSDNNLGATRTLPTNNMRDHKGGYGMYYHMDMHGGPYSYQWIGSTYLPKVWEQMTAVYEFGVREIWVTNIGDIGTQEFGLSFFLDLAYDMEQWGGEDAKITQIYTRKWIEKQFSPFLTNEDRRQIEKVIWDYTFLLAKRKHEVMNDKVYHPVHYGEADEVLCIAENILSTCESIKSNCTDNNMASFISLIYYPACATANLMKLWILTGKNKLYAKQNRVETNLLNIEIDKCIVEDKRLIKEYMAVDHKFFFGFGMSEHIGFTTWCDEDNKYPQLTYIHPAKRPRMIVVRHNDENYLTGDFWRDKPQTWLDCMRQDVTEIVFDIACASEEPIVYEINTDSSWLSFSKKNGVISYTDQITLTIHKEMFIGKQQGKFTVENVGYGKVEIIIEAENNIEIPQNVFMENDDYIAMEASHFEQQVKVKNGKFVILDPCGRTGSAIKVFPTNVDYYKEENRPYVEYHFMTNNTGEYEIQFYMEATTPVIYESKQYIGFSINEEPIQIMNTIKKENEQFFLSKQWEEEAFQNCKITDAVVKCEKGKNKLRFYAMSPAIVLERIILHPIGKKLPDSYLGPKESYRREVK